MVLGLITFVVIVVGLRRRALDAVARNIRGPRGVRGEPCGQVVIVSGVLGGGTALVFAAAALVATMFPTARSSRPTHGAETAAVRCGVGGDRRSDWCPAGARDVADRSGGADRLGIDVDMLDASPSEGEPLMRAGRRRHGRPRRRHRARVRGRRARRDAVPERRAVPTSWNGGCCDCAAAAGASPASPIPMPMPIPMPARGSGEGRSCSCDGGASIVVDVVGAGGRPSPRARPRTSRRSADRGLPARRGLRAAHPILSRPCASSPDSSTATIASWPRSSR